MELQIAEQIMALLHMLFLRRIRLGLSLQIRNAIKLGVRAFLSGIQPFDKTIYFQTKKVLLISFKVHILKWVLKLFFCV